jgi:hypothetical protein
MSERETSAACVADPFARAKEARSGRYVHHTPTGVQAAGRIRLVKMCALASGVVNPELSLGASARGSRVERNLSAYGLWSMEMNTIASVRRRDVAAILRRLRLVVRELSEYAGRPTGRSRDRAVRLQAWFVRSRSLHRWQRDRRIDKLPVSSIQSLFAQHNSAIASHMSSMAIVALALGSSGVICKQSQSHSSELYKLCRHYRAMI